MFERRSEILLILIQEFVEDQIFLVVTRSETQIQISEVLKIFGYPLK